MTWRAKLSCQRKVVSWRAIITTVSVTPSPHHPIRRLHLLKSPISKPYGPYVISMRCNIHTFYYKSEEILRSPVEARINFSTDDAKKPNVLINFISPRRYMHLAFLAHDHLQLMIRHDPTVTTINWWTQLFLVDGKRRQNKASGSCGPTTQTLAAV